MKVPKRFEGDGRKSVNPVCPFPHSKPVTRAMARQLIDAFEKTGESAHSPRALTLWVILEYCHFNNIGYVLETQPISGFYIRRKSREP